MLSLSQADRMVRELVKVARQTEREGIMHAIRERAAGRPRSQKGLGRAAQRLKRAEAEVREALVTAYPELIVSRKG